MSSKYIPEHARKQPISAQMPVEAEVPPDLSQMETMIFPEKDLKKQENTITIQISTLFRRYYLE